MEIDDKEFEAEMRKIGAELANKQKRNTDLAMAITGLHEMTTHTLIASGVQSLEEIYSDNVNNIVSTALKESQHGGKTDILKATRILISAMWRFTHAAQIGMTERLKSDSDDNSEEPMMI